MRILFKNELLEEKFSPQCALKKQLRFSIANLFVKDTGSDESLGNRVRIAVRRGATVFEVSFLGLGTVAWNSDAGAAVGHA